MCSISSLWTILYVQHKLFLPQNSFSLLNLKNLTMKQRENIGNYLLLCHVCGRGTKTLQALIFRFVLSLLGG